MKRWLGRSTSWLWAKRATALAGVSAALLTLSGCQNIEINSSNQSNVRFVAASSNAPGLDFYFGASPVAYNIGFGTVTSYAAVNPGSYTVNADQAATKSVLAAASTSLAAAHNYTVLVGNVAAGLEETVLPDQALAAPTGDISVRILDQATRAGAVDVYLVPSTGKLAGTSVLVTGLNFGTNTGYLNVPAGTYAITVVPTGTVPVSGTATLLAGASVAYASGAVRTVVLLDTVVTNTSGVQAVVGVDYDPPSAGGPA